MKERLIIVAAVFMMMLGLSLPVFGAGEAITVNGGVSGITAECNEQVRIVVRAPEEATAVRVWKKHGEEDGWWDYYDRYATLSYLEVQERYHTGTRSVRAEYCTVDYADGEDLSQIGEESWQELGEVFFTVQDYAGFLSAPYASLSSETVPAGGWITVTISRFQNKGEWYWAELEHERIDENGTWWEGCGHYDFDSVSVNGNNSYSFANAGYVPGNYRLRVFCEAVDYEQGEKELLFTITENDALPEEYLRLSAETARAQTQVSVTARAVGADGMELTAEKAEDPQWRSDPVWIDGESGERGVMYDQPGTYYLTLTAYTEEGSYTAGTATLTVTAEGYLDVPRFESFPAVFDGGESFSGIIALDERAEECHISLEYCPEDESWETLYWGYRDDPNGMLEFTLPEDLFTTDGRYKLHVHSYAPGLEGSWDEYWFIRQEASGGAGMTLKVNGGTGDISGLYAHQEIRVELEAPEEVTAVRVLSDGNWDYWADAGDFSRDYSFAGGDIVLIAQATTDPPVWNEEGFDWGSFRWETDVNWESYSNAVVLHVDTPYGRLAAPEISLSSPVFSRGEWLQAEVLSEEDADWYWGKIRRLALDEFGNPRWEDLMECPMNVDRSVTFPAAVLSPGDYYLAVGAVAVGFDEAERSVPFTVTESSESLPAVGLYFPEDLILTSQDIPFYGFAQDADFLAVHVTQEGNPEWHNDYDANGERGSWRFSVSEQGTYLFTMEAYREGESLGEAAYTLIVEAPYGNLGDPEIEGLPGQMETNMPLQFSVIQDSCAQECQVKLIYCPEGGNWEHLYEDFREQWDTDFSLPGELFGRAGLYRLEVNSFAMGYQSNYFAQQFLVTEDQERSISLLVNGSEEGITDWLSLDDLYVDVYLPENATAVRILNGDHWDWYDEEDFVEAALHFPAGSYLIAAQATSEEPYWRAENFDWSAFDPNRDLSWTMISNTVQVRVTSPFGRLEAPVLWVPEEVYRGEWLEITIQEVQDAEGYHVRVISRDTEGYENDCRFDWHYDEAGTFLIPTSEMEAESTYYVQAWSDAVGYESGTAREIVFTVADSVYSPYFTSNKEEESPGECQVLTGEEFTLSVFASGADRIRLFCDGELWAERDGEGMWENRSMDRQGAFEIKALYTEDDGASWNSAGTLLLLVSAPNGTFETSISAPASLTTSDTADIIVTIRNQGGHFGLETGLYDSQWNYVPIEPIGWGDGASEDEVAMTYRVSGENLRDGEIYTIQAEVRPMGLGYSMARTRCELPVTDGSRQGTVTVSSTEPLRFEEVTIQAQVPGATALYVYEGQNRWTGILGESASLRTDFTEEGEVRLYARYTTQEITETDPDQVDFETLSWEGTTEIVTVHVRVTDILSRPDFTLNNDTVSRGQPFRISINSLQGKNEWYGARLQDEEGNDLSGELANWNETSQTIMVDTSEAEPGQYYLFLWTDAIGCEGFQIRTPVTVEEPLADIYVIVPDSPLLTQDFARVTGYAPGAASVRMGIKQPEMEEPEYFEEEGERLSLEIIPGRKEGICEITVTAYDTAGNVIGEEAGSIQLIAPYGDRPLARVYMSDEWTEGEDLAFSVDGGDAMFLDVAVLDAETEEILFEDLRYGDWNYYFPASLFEWGHRYEIYVFSSGVGYNYGEFTYFVAPLPAEADTLFLPGNVTEIREEAFKGASAQKIVLPESAMELEARAFSDCKELLVVVLPESLTDIPGDAFEGSGPATVYGMAGSALEELVGGIEELSFICLTP